MEEVINPVTICELVQLAHLKIPLHHVTWARVTMTSDRYICIRHSEEGSSTASSPDDSQEKEKSPDKSVLITLLNPYTSGLPPETWSVGFADAAVMSPTRSHLAVKISNRFTVINIETHTVISRCTVTESVHYWTWAHADVIAIVTDTAVLHWWLYEENSEPDKIFDRHERLMYAEIVSYKCDQNLKWLALTGLLPQEEGIEGLTQMYSVDSSVSQCIEAHAVTFAQYQFEKNASPTTVFCVAGRESQGYGRVHLIELGPHIAGNLAPSSHYDHIRFPEDPDHYDFPVALQVSPRYGLVYLITKYGYLYLNDLETAASLTATPIPISTEVVFASAVNSETEGILAVSRNGQVLSVDIKEDSLLEYVTDITKKVKVSERLQKLLGR